jgi:hypothetical protein
LHAVRKEEVSALSFQKWNFHCSGVLFRRRQSNQTAQRAEERSMSLGTIILIILVIALLGGFSGIGGGPFYGTGYYGGGGLGLVIVILLILLLLGKL